jgi:hypothetical protein
MVLSRGTVRLAFDFGLELVDVTDALDALDALVGDGIRTQGG